MGNHVIKKRIISVALAIAIIASVLGVGVVADSKPTAESSAVELQLSKDSYAYYLSQKEGVSPATTKGEVSIPSVISSAEVDLITNDANETAMEFKDSDSFAEWNVTAATEGLYNIIFTYAAVNTSGKEMNVGITLNGVLPYEEAARIRLEQKWYDDVPNNEEFETDEQGNDILPGVNQSTEIITNALYDSEGYYSEPLVFHLQQGENKIRITSNGDSFRLYGLAITPIENIPSYANYIKSVEGLNHSEVKDYTYKVQAEHPLSKSSPLIFASTDFSDPKIEPSDAFSDKRNIIGTTNWKNAGQYLEWEIEVPEDGNYKLGIKYRQNTNRGLYNLRKLYIDGKVPFAEAGNLKFGYTDKFDLLVPGDDDGDYMFYLTKGKHTIKLEVTVDELAETIWRVEYCADRISVLKNKIIMITSNDPDVYRDYDLDIEVPGLVDELKEVSGDLYSIGKKFEEITGETGTNAVTLMDTAELLEKFANKPYTIPEKLTEFTDSISTLSTWANSLKEQLLELDYITVMSPDVKTGKVTAGFFSSIVHEIKMLVNSYISDYGDGLFSDADNVQVWISGGRDQLYTLKELVNKANLGFDVDIKLAGTGVTSAIMAGFGPDVALNLAKTDPVNLGMRGALEPLNDYEGFDELKSQFSQSSFTPFYLEGKCYGIPETQTFNMMFVRTDILSQLGLEVPRTWDEFANITRILQQNNMEAGLPGDLFATLLYQNGGQYFNEKQDSTTFDSPLALDCFKKNIEYYNDYAFSLFKNDYTRFRTGEMPVSIMPYSTYNTLSVAAPEINNKWEMYLVPGVQKEDGTIDVTNIGQGGTVSVILKSSNNKEKAWEFLRWWGSAETQAAFGNRIEYIMGSSARYATANQKAFDMLPWSINEAKIIKEQWKTVVEIPEVPGGYYIARNISNAFNASVTRTVDIKETFNYWSNETNKEIKRKRKQYGLD